MSSKNKNIVIKLKTKSGEIKTGKFVIKQPTIGDLLRIKNLASSFNSGIPVDEETKKFNEKIAKALVLIKEKPDWFDLDNLPPSYLPVLDKILSFIDEDFDFFREIEAVPEQE